MDTYYVQFGWCMVLVAAVFGLGLTPRLGPRFYPDSPGILVRLAAPLIFGGLAVLCFLGLGQEGLVSTAALGLSQVAVSRWRKRRAAIPVV